MMTSSCLTFPLHVAASLRGSKYQLAITGGSGWLGQTVLEMLDSALGEEISERVHVFGSTARTLVLRSGRSLECKPLSEIETLHTGSWLILHFAFLTRDKVSQLSTADYVSRNEALSAKVLRAVRRVKPVGVLLASSGAVYRSDRSLETDMTNNPYGVLKARDEAAFSKLAEAMQFRLVAPRIFNLSGPFINKIEHYALSSMIVSAWKEGAIAIRASHRVVRSYVYAPNLISLCFAHLLASTNVSLASFDTAGEVEIEMAQLAESIVVALGLRNVQIHRLPVASEKEDIYVGNRKHYEAIARQHQIRLLPLAEQIQQTAKFLAPPAKGRCWR